MDKTALVSLDIERGREVLDAIERTKLKMAIALWVYSSEYEDWRILLSARYFTSLTNPEIEQYLKRNDVIFIPVGAIETFGPMPTGMEYTMGEAYALRMAEETDGLILPWVTYFYPGVTVTGVGSVYVPQNVGFEYLKAIAHSLLRQGFRRQLYLFAHGPANQ